MTTNIMARKGQSNKGTALFANTGHVVAHVKTDAQGVIYLHKSLDGPRHFLRTPPAIAFDLTVIDQAERHGCRYALVLDRDDKHTYKASLATMQAHGFKVSRGHGPQWGLTFDHWEERDATGRLLKSPHEKEDKPQLGLWGTEDAA